jgi:hypothetical protein
VKLTDFSDRTGALGRQTSLTRAHAADDAIEPPDFRTATVESLDGC